MGSMSIILKIVDRVASLSRSRTKWVAPAFRKVDRIAIEKARTAWCERGAQVGIGTRLIRDLDSINPHLISVGDYCVIGGFILAHGPTGIGKKVRIGSFVYMGWDSIVLPGVTIGDDCIIGAGAVVTKSVPSGCVVAGNPARVIRAVNREELEEFKRAMLHDEYIGAVKPPA
jgi:acetyltransferase-like isoleucine patch superfamily enzyme